MRTRRQEKGERGEKLAATFLRGRGYRILTANYTTLFGEIDLVARQAGELVFVEVKTRSGSQFGTPQESITRRKADHWRKAALAYLKATNHEQTPYRFDFVGVDLSGDKPQISLIENFLED